jgi:predicted type IV restriction endonuclease
VALAEHIERVKQRLKEGAYTSEASVSQGILLPALNELGWPVFDTTIVVPEFSLEGRRVDFALCHPAKKPSIFIEVKKVGLSDGADKQLFEYAFHLGVPVAILTDGQEWSFYLPGEQGLYDERRVYKLDLLERDTDEAARRLERYLSYQRVCNGEALTAARADYKNVARDREIAATFPKAWSTLLEEQDSLLLDLLAEKVEDLCGYKPVLDACSQFLYSVARGLYPPDAEVSKPRPSPPPSAAPTRAVTQIRTRTVEHFSFVFKGRTYEAGSAREVMTRLFQLFSNEDSGFFDRFASRKHGKKRRYLARNRFELYPGREDLVEEHSVEVSPGWWMGTNYSRRDIQKIIDLALEVAGPGMRGAVKVNVE